MENNGYRLQTSPMKHQQTGLERALAKPVAFAHLAETGTGKSQMVLAEYQHRLSEDDIMDLLVLAPKGSIKNWYRDKADDQPAELKRHLDPNLLKNLVIADNVKNAASRNARIYLIRAAGRPRALFVNIESLSYGSKGQPTETEMLCRNFMQHGKTMMVIDESTTIRAQRAERTRAVLRLGRMARCRRILTGLVTPKSPLDLYCQFNFLDEKILGMPDYVAFRARYAEVKMMCFLPNTVIDAKLDVALRRRRMHFNYKHLTRDQKIAKILELGGYITHVPMVQSYRNLDELQQRIAPYSYQILKRDCLDLQPKIYEPRDIELTGEQAKLYQQIKQEATAKLANGTHITATNVLAQMTRLHQIVCGHVKDELGKIQDIKSRRIDEILDVLAEHEGKAIIWVTYTHELEKIATAIAATYGPESVARFFGGNAGTRDEDEKRFLSDPYCRFIVSTPASGGRGNTWNVATLAVYAASSHDLEHRYQSEDRCHRIGQHNSVTYVDLIVRGTVEEKIIKALRKKIDLAKAITGENYRDWLI